MRNRGPVSRCCCDGVVSLGEIYICVGTFNFALSGGNQPFSVPGSATINGNIMTCGGSLSAMVQWQTNDGGQTLELTLL